MLNGLDKDRNIIISSKRKHYFEGICSGQKFHKSEGVLIFDEVTKLKESNIIVAANCTCF